MNTNINDIIVNIKQIESLLLAQYQAEAVGDLDREFRIAMRVNNLMIDSGLRFAGVTTELLERMQKKYPKLTLVK